MYVPRDHLHTIREKIKPFLYAHPFQIARESERERERDLDTELTFESVKDMTGFKRRTIEERKQSVLRSEDNDVSDDET